MVLVVSINIFKDFYIDVSLLFQFLFQYCKFVVIVFVVKHNGLGCCDVVLNREEFFNATALKSSKRSEPPIEPYGPQLYRKSLNIYTGEISTKKFVFFQKCM